MSDDPTRTCDAFLLAWNQALDEGRAPVFPDPVQLHALACDRCRRRAETFGMLRRAIALTRPAAPPADFAPRVLAAARRDLVAARKRRVRWGAAVVSAAAVVALLAWPAGPPIVMPPGIDPEPHRVESKPLVQAVSEATAASWDLARETSGPATRIGRDVIGAARDSLGDWPSGLESADVAGVLNDMGGRVERDVEPLTGSARKAFGFLASPTAIAVLSSSPDER